MDGLADREGGGGGGGVTSSGSCLDREMRIVSVYELSGVGEQIAQNMLNYIHCNYHSQRLKYLVNARGEVPFQNNLCVAIFSAGNTRVFRDKYGIE
ncbi:hypothetical protein HZH68_007536 [Vespula germanica]|nr:hypothetical protein HZH68_007536 [Vespula germanica]